MKKNSKTIKIFYISILALLIFSSVAFAVSNPNSKEEAYAIEDGQILSNLSDKYEKSAEEINRLKDEYESWGKVTYQLIYEKYKELLTKERLDALREEGYSIFDISKATELAVICGRTSEEILETKGKDEEDKYTLIREKDKDGNDIETVINNNDKLWDEVIQKLGINLEDTAIELGMTPDKVSYMKKNKMSQRQIFDAAMLAQNFDKDIEQISNEFLNGRNRDELASKYAQENKKTQIPVSDEIINPNNSPESILKNAYQISDEEILYFKQKGINKLGDIGHAKHLAAKNKITVEQVVETWRKMKNWDEVSNELQGGAGQ